MTKNVKKPVIIVPYIPAPIVIDILSRTPIKTLFNCRLVCKNWATLTSTPEFAQLHLSRSPTSCLINPHLESLQSEGLHLVDLVYPVRPSNKLVFVPKINFLMFQFGCSILAMGWFACPKSSLLISVTLAISMCVIREQFGEVPEPSENQVRYGKEVSVINGNLSICDYSNHDQIVIWVMKEYGVKESWSKDIVITHRISNFDSYELIMTNGNGKILMIFNKKSIIIYDPESKAFESELQIFAGFRSEFEAIAHVPSLISLKDVAKGSNLKCKQTELLNVQLIGRDPSLNKLSKIRVLFLVYIFLLYCTFNYQESNTILSFSFFNLSFVSIS
ncbi:hypothetical protein LguiA_033313 [Lonicera macranthoides]